MPKKKKCSNPLGLDPPHGREIDLRRIPPQYLKKLENVTEDSLVCSKCRQAVANYEPPISEEFSGTSSSFSSLPRTMSDALDGNYVLSSSQASSGNKETIDVTLGVSPVKRKKLVLQSYKEQKGHEIANAALTKYQSDFGIIVEQTETEKLIEVQNYILSRIKDSLQQKMPNEFKMNLISLLPKDWSIEKIRDTTGASNYLINKTRKMEQSSGTMKFCLKPGQKPLTTEVVDLIAKFYEDDDNSRQLPGMKDFVSIKELDGSIIKVQKRLVLCNINELYAAFKEKNPSIKVGFSTFAKLRPKHCVLAGDPGTCVVCVCLLHQNMKLMLEGCKLLELFDDRPVDGDTGILTYRSFLELMICPNPTDACYDRKCPMCIGKTEDIIELFKNKFIEREITEIRFKMWATVDRCDIITRVSSSEDFLQALTTSLDKLLPHDFVVKKQSQYFKELKSQLGTGELILLMDFSENYGFIVQDAVQAYHWNNPQATIFPVVVYYTQDNELHHLSYIGISEWLKHDTISVYMFQKRLIELLKVRFEKITKIHYISDGAPQHFKNKKTFINLVHHMQDFQIEAAWNFSPTAHGKSASDGVGGYFKREAKRASLQMGTKQQILTPYDLYEWGRSRMENVELVYCSNGDHQFYENELRLRFLEARGINGTLSYHYIAPSTEANYIICKRYSTCEAFSKHRIF